MTGYGYEDPRSIHSEESRKRAGTRSPREILESIKEKETREMSDKKLLLKMSDKLRDAIQSEHWAELLVLSGRMTVKARHLIMDTPMKEGER